MKWTARQPQRNAQRTRKRFAWWPVNLTSGATVWLEYYFEVSQYYHMERSINNRWKVIARYQAKQPYDRG